MTPSPTPSEGEAMPHRDIEIQPYSADEKRVVDFIWERGLGGGDDPIGFILASYAYLVAERNELRAATYTEICMNEKCPRGLGVPVEVVRALSPDTPREGKK